MACQPHRIDTQRGSPARYPNIIMLLRTKGALFYIVLGPLLNSKYFFKNFVLIIIVNQVRLALDLEHLISNLRPQFEGNFIGEEMAQVLDDFVEKDC